MALIFYNTYLSHLLPVVFSQTSTRVIALQLSRKYNYSPLIAHPVRITSPPTHCDITPHDWHTTSGNFKKSFGAFFMNYHFDLYVPDLPLFKKVSLRVIFFVTCRRDLHRARSDCKSVEKVRHGREFLFALTRIDLRWKDFYGLGVCDGWD